MKKCLPFIGVLLIANSWSISARNYMLMGKVTGADGAVVTEGFISVVSNEKTYVANIKEGGLYNTDNLPEGNYKIYITANNTTYTSYADVQSPELAKGEKAVFYNITLSGTTAIVNKTTEDPYAASHLDKVKDEPVLVADPPSVSRRAYFSMPGDVKALPYETQVQVHVMAKPEQDRKETKTPHFFSNDDYFSLKNRTSIKKVPAVLKLEEYNKLKKKGFILR